MNNRDTTRRATLIFDSKVHAADPPGTFAWGLHALAHHARLRVGAHQSALSYIPNGDFKKAIHTHSFSSEYERYNTYDVMPTGKGIWSVVVEEKIPVRMTDKELKSHPRWKNFSDMKDVRGLAHPQMDGWLAIPILEDGRLLGVLQLSAKYEGADFSEDDERILVELAQVTAPFFANQYALLQQLQQGKRRRLTVLVGSIIIIIILAAYAFL